MSAHDAATALELALGPADHPASEAGWGEAVRADEAEAFPEAFVETLESHRFLSHFVPVELGGRLTSIEEAAAVTRTVARRDLTAAIALGQSFLGSVPVWIKGSPAQKKRQAEALLGGKASALALTEEAHGADILSSGVRATRAGTDFSLNGEKWLINNGTRAELLSVFARTEDAGGLSGFTLFQVDRTRLNAEALRALPKQRTHGIRGADISGVGFHDARLPGDAAIGNVGSGLETALLALQVTRVGCASFALGAADTALRVATRFATQRQLFGGAVAAIPHARDLLASAYLDLLIAEALARGASRGLHATPDEMSVASSVVKFLVPTLCEQVTRDAAVVLGARHYLRTGVGQGIFQKMQRDLAVVPLFDGSTPVNLDGVATQLLRWDPVRRGGVRPLDPTALAFRFGPARLSAFDPSGLQLMAQGGDAVLDGLPDVAFAVAQASPKLLLPVATRLAAAAEQLVADTRALAPTVIKRSTALFALAERYCRLHAAASCVHHFWTLRKEPTHAFIADGVWLAAAVGRCLGDRAVPPPEVAARLFQQVEQGRWLSHFDVPAP